MKEQALLYFFAFSDFTVSRYFLFYRFYREADRTSLQVYIYLASVLFLLKVQRKHQKPDNQSRRQVYTQRYDSTTEPLCILLAFRLAHLHTRTRMIPPFCQSAMNSEMITPRYRQVKVRKMTRRRSEKRYFRHSGSPLNLIILQKRYCFQQSRGFKKPKNFRFLCPNHGGASG